MTVLRLEHIGIVVDDLAAATAFFTALGLDVEGETSVEGPLVDRINGLDDVRADVVILRTPDGNSKIELCRYHSPAYTGDDAAAPPAHTPGIRHVLFVVDRRRGVARRPERARRRAGRRARELRGQLLALLRARPGGGHRRTRAEGRLMLFGQEHVVRYRETDGEEGHDWQGTTVLLLTTTGRRSGAERTTPLIYQRHGDDYLVVASNGGGDPPGWFLNLKPTRR